MRDEDDSASGGDGSFNDSNNVGNRQTVEKRPHGEVLESSRGRRELVAKGIILHVDAHQIVQSRSREAQNARDLLGVEQVSSLVPVNPHTTEVITQQVVQRIAGEEAQAVRDPIGLVWVIIKVGLGLLAQFPNGLGALLIGTGPDAQRDTIQRVRRILLENKGVVGTVRLALASANLDIVGEACLIKRREG